MPDADRQAHNELTAGLCQTVVKYASDAGANPADACSSLLSVVAIIAASLRSAPEANQEVRDAVDEVSRRWEAGFKELMSTVRRGEEALQPPSH